MVLTGSFWNAVKLSSYNMIILFPLGVYLSMLYRVNKLSKCALIVFLVSLSIEIYQVIMGYVGIVWGRGFDVDDLILNTLGGIIGFIVAKMIWKFFIKLKKHALTFSQSVFINLPSSESLE